MGYLMLAGGGLTGGEPREIEREATVTLLQEVAVLRLEYQLVVRPTVEEDDDDVLW